MMFINWDWLTTENHAKIAPIFKNNSMSVPAVENNFFYHYWYNNVTKGHYWAASMIVPCGSLFILTIVILLMVLFERCPLAVTGVVAAILCFIIVFVIYATVSNTPIYA